MRTCFFRNRAALGLLLSACFVPAVRGDMVVLKDGLTLHGKVRRQGSVIIDPVSGQAFEIAKINGFFSIDDEARRVIFSARQVAEEGVEDRDLNREADLVRLSSRRVINLDHFMLPPSVFLDVPPWDERWERAVKLETPTGKQTVVQRITQLTPLFTRAESLRYRWNPCYLTRELDPEAVRKLLAQHPDLKSTGSPGDDAGKRFRVYRFLTQAGWYDVAGRELDAIARDFPDQKERVGQNRDNLQKLRLMQALDELERGYKAGRYQWVRDQLTRMPQEGVEESLAVRAQTLRTQLETSAANLRLARHFLADLPVQLGDKVTERELLAEAAATILGELHPDTVGRLEAFLSLAQQAERARQQSRTPDQTPDQLLALAITGWLLGGGSAEAMPDAAAKLWKARRLVLEYQTTAGAGTRQKLVQTAQKTSGVAFDELAQIIRHAPPPEPWPLSMLHVGDLASRWLQGMALAAGQIPPVPAPAGGAGVATLTLTTGGLPPPLAFGKRRDIAYALQLPPEYQHGRAWPLLVALHNTGERREEVLKRWGWFAAAYGYLLAVPEWGAFNHPYDYSADEHTAVLDVLRDLRRRFQIDNDRVFMTGWGEGGNMAYDVGLSHPDQFAGVVPMAARPRYHARAYWHNAQYLPLYVIDGDCNGDSPKDNRQQFTNWVGRGYPALYVEYKGRCQEFFSGELPRVLDWMGRQKRTAAFPELGKAGVAGASGEEFQSLRETDNRFYWLTGNGIRERNTAEADRWRGSIVPASLQARIGERNNLFVTSHGYRSVTVWLGQGMIDFDKAITVFVNAQQRMTNRKVPPNLGTLLEDFYQRGDRQRLYWARLEFSL